MTSDLVLLAVLMFAATYPSRAVGLLTPGLERLPRVALDYLQLVGPAILTALAAVGVMVVVDDAGDPSFHLGIEWVAVLCERPVDEAVVGRVDRRREEAPVEDDRVERAVVLVLVPRAAWDLDGDDNLVLAHHPIPSSRKRRPADSRADAR